ncbi:MAG: hypothetical protein U0414_36790 [Polyangiaceae bacterium]
MRWKWAAGASCAGVLISVGVGAGCLSRPLEVGAPVTTFINSQRATSQAVTKIDILLAIDNSSSMKDKQELLGDAVPDLVDRLVNPRCVDADGTWLGMSVKVPADCPTGYAREFPPVLDINVGVISSALGALGNTICGAEGPEVNDAGHLLTRGITLADTYNEQGFLAWDPNQERGGEGDSGKFSSTLKNMVEGVSDGGCGFEMQLESVYRFLVDPHPHKIVTAGVPEAADDQEVLDARKQFLREDSLVAVIMLTDENDCSFKPTKKAFDMIGAQTNPRSSSICATQPNDKCCYACGDGPPAGCSNDANCATNYEGANGKNEDDINLRCWEQKRRYGADYLFPTQRYVNAFTRSTIDPTADDLTVASGAKGESNPLINAKRGADLVFFAGIVGVPWQTIANTGPSGPDLTLGFKKVSDLKNERFFEAYVGDPDQHVQPTAGIMMESIAKRPGVTASDPNGGDRDIKSNKDLQYTCIYDLAKPIEDADANARTCPVGFENPVCDPVTHQQIKAKAYPGLRELAVLGGMGDQGIPASICPASIDPTDTSIPYGYGPAVETIINRLKEKLSPGCFNRKLKTDGKGGAACIVVEATVEDGGQLDCNTIAGRAEVPADEVAAIDAIKRDALANPEWNSFCAIPQVSGEGAPSPREQCQTLDDVQDPNVDGWCYIDASSFPQIGNPDLKEFEKCPENEQRLIRFVGDGKPRGNGTTFITCVGEASE